MSLNTFQEKMNYCGCQVVEEGQYLRVYFDDELVTEIDSDSTTGQSLKIDIVPLVRQAKRDVDTSTKDTENDWQLPINEFLRYLFNYVYEGLADHEIVIC